MEPLSKNQPGWFLMKKREIFVLHNERGKYRWRTKHFCGSSSYPFSLSTRRVAEGNVISAIMDIVKPIHDAESILGCICVRWITYDDVDYTQMKVLVTERQPSALW